ncbi:MAG TPA: type II toxin-antitoxin system HicB family antitoxin [Candidatus Paceibacterota bacterium]|nr:type II toxin-antitoxin system HicB family antitoxin [Candidatus Paceibacterota bacterium]
MKKTDLRSKAARYTKIVEWSDEDGCFVGSAPPIIGQCCHGDNEAKVYAELCQIVEEWIELLETDGSTLPAPLGNVSDFSGKFVLRVEPAIHRRLAAKALAAGESLNSYCVKTLVKA